MDQDLERVLDRQRQLQTLSYIIIMALLTIVGVLVYALARQAMLADLWLARNEVLRSAVPGLLLMVILYMIDQHQRLRRQLTKIHDDLEVTTSKLQASVDRLSFAHRAAEAMSSLTARNGLDQVLHEALERFNVDAVALVSDDIRLVTRAAAARNDAHLVIEQAALEAVRAGAPLRYDPPDSGTHALAVPLHIDGKLSSVLCVWRASEPFYEQDLEGVELVAHIIQISLENDQLLERTRAQLYGTLMALAELVGLRRPDYEDHAAKVAELAVSTGIMLGLTTQEIADLRVASVLHDVGMLEAPDAITRTDRPLTPAEEATIRRHPAAGARILTTARLDEKIKEAVLCHHERLDGSGYPSGLKGDAIPLSARIIGVCDTYVALTSERPYRHALSERAAFAEVQRAAGRLFDPRVVDALGVVTGNIRAGAAVGDELALMLGQVG